MEDILFNRLEIEFKYNYKIKLILNFFDNSLLYNILVYRFFF